MANVTLRCADNRLNELTAKKFADDLILAELGGVKWHLARDSMEELFEQIEFVVERKGAKRVNLIAHTDCAFYQELGEDSPDQLAEDLREAAGTLRERFPELEVTGYLYDVETKELKRIANGE